MTENKPMTAVEEVVQLRAVRKTYREGRKERLVLDDADASFYRGELAVLIGKSGSGKSTLLNLVGGIDLPDAGQVFVDGTDLATLAEEERTLFRRHHIGFIFQFFNLIPTLTVAENVLLPLELQGRDGVSEREKVAELLDRVGLGDRGASFPEQLSGGEQQRVAIARALAHEPALVLADEPTGNLDEETSHEVMSLLEELVRERGKTLILVTHSRQVVDRADRVLRIAGGRFVDAGPSGEPENSARSVSP